MFTEKVQEIIPRQEASLLLVLRSLIAQLSNRDGAFLDSVDLQTKVALDNLKNWYDHISFPRVRPEDKRIAGPVDIFYASLTNVLRRDLSRILNLYAFLDQVEGKIDGLTSNPQSYFAQARDIIIRILATTRNAAVQDAVITDFDFRNVSDLEDTNAFQDIAAGIVTSAIDSLTPLISTWAIQSSRPLFTSNPYSVLVPAPVSDLVLGSGYYDINGDAVELTLSSELPDGFNHATVEMNSAFQVKAVEADLANNNTFVDITNQVIGQAVNINGQSFAVPTPRSIIQPNGISKYSFWFPELAYRVRIRVALLDNNLQQVEIVQITDNHGRVIDSFSEQDSLLFLRKVSVHGKEVELQVLQDRSSVGQVNVVSLAKPLKFLQVSTLELKSPSGSKDSTTRIKTVTSSKAISSVEIYVDSYDPSNLIKYYVDSTRAERLPIDPVNSNPVNPTKVEFKDSYPQQVNIIVTIPQQTGYYPTLNGIAVRTKEIDI